HRPVLEDEAPHAVGGARGLGGHARTVGTAPANSTLAGEDLQPASFFFKSSLSCAGFALPPVALITWPTKKPNSLSLPERYSASCAGFLANTSSITRSIAALSVICLRPLSAITASALAPLLHMASNTSLAILP